MKKAIHFIGNAIWGVLSIFIILGLLLVLLGVRPNIVLSGSMEPAIQTGSICFVNTNADYEDIKAGDIIAFKNGRKQVTHRAIAITNSGIETKGDNNDLSDGITTTEENFIGKTIFSIPYLGYFFQFILTRKGKMVVCAAIVALLVICFVGNRSDEEESS